MQAHPDPVIAGRLPGTNMHASFSTDRTAVVNGKDARQLYGFEAAWGYAQTVRVGPLLFVSGTVSIDSQGRPRDEGDMAAQVRNVYADLGRSLALHDADLGHVVHETLVTTDLPRFIAEAATVRAAAYAGHGLPASAPWI